MPRRNERRIYLKREPKWRIGRIFKFMDNFGYEVPGLNIRGETSISTVYGGALTIYVLCISLLYAIAQVKSFIKTLIQSQVTASFQMASTQ